MSPYYLFITYFLVSGTPVLVEPVAALRDNGRPIVEAADCLERRDYIIRKFHEDRVEALRAGNNVFYDISVECRRKEPKGE